MWQEQSAPRNFLIKKKAKSRAKTVLEVKQCRNLENLFSEVHKYQVSQSYHITDLILQIQSWWNWQPSPFLLTHPDLLSNATVTSSAECSELGPCELAAPQMTPWSSRLGTPGKWQLGLPCWCHLSQPWAAVLLPQQKVVSWHNSNFPGRGENTAYSG